MELSEEKINEIKQAVKNTKEAVGEFDFWEFMEESYMEYTKISLFAGKKLDELEKKLKRIPLKQRAKYLKKNYPEFDRGEKLGIMIDLIDEKLKKIVSDKGMEI